MNFRNIAADKSHPIGVGFDEGMIWVTLNDGRVIGAPLTWFAWLNHATEDQRANFELGALSVYWPDLDDGIDIQALITGHWTKPMDQPMTTTR